MSGLSSNPSPVEIRQARAFLQQRGFNTSMMPPRIFAFTAKKTNKSYAQLLQMIAMLKMGGQGLGPSPVASSIATASSLT